MPDTAQHFRPTAASAVVQTPGNGRAPRHGRALVECLVAALLLAITTLAVAATTRGTLALADDSALVTHAQAMATTHAEDALANNCRSQNGQDQQTRLTVAWQQTSNAQTTLLHMRATLERSPIAFDNRAPLTFTLEAGGTCQ